MHRVVILCDIDPGDGGEGFQRAAEIGLAEVRAAAIGDNGALHDVEVSTVVAEGHPRGEPAVTVKALRELATDPAVLAVIGPAVADNAIACTPVADEVELPTINWSGSQLTRSRWMFHYQVGSLEDEPFVLARHLAARRLRRVGLVREDSIIGRQLASFFADAAELSGLELLGCVDLAVSGDDGGAAVAGLGALAPEAVVYFGLGVSASGLARALVGETWPVVANSALMFAHAFPELFEDVDGWIYVDACDETNALRRALLEQIDCADALGIGPVATYDMGRLVGYGLARAPELTRAGVREGLERVKQVPSALGSPGTIMGFGNWKHNALEGGFLVLRQWRDGKSEMFDA